MMGLPNGIEFRDYLDAGGRNVIHDWTKAIGAKATAKLNAVILMLAAAAPDWSGLKQVKKIKGTEIWELRFEINRIAYRPLFYRGTGHATLLIGATEVNDRFVPPGALDTAEKRRKIVEKDSKRSVPHDFS